MGQRGSGSLFPQQQCNLQSRNSNSWVAPVYSRLRYAFPAFDNGCINTINADRIFPSDVKPLHSCVGHENEPCGWINGLPRFCRGFSPALAPGSKEPVFTIPDENRNPPMVPNSDFENAQKRFLVFDQSGDQTTLIFSSGLGTSWTLNPPDAFNSNRVFLRQASIKTDLNIGLGQIHTNGVDGNSGPDIQNEMHEDTEELNALLYSDDDSGDPEDDEVTSTGHSPSTMTCHDKPESCRGSTGRAASFIGLSKKRKLSDDCNEQVLDTASSVRPKDLGPKYEDGAEISCASGKSTGSRDAASPLGSKRIRKEKIRETVSLLRSIVPGVEEKDVVAVLNEAIDYLKSLKRKAEAFGLNSL